MTDELFKLGVHLASGVDVPQEDIAKTLARTNDPQTSKDAAKKMVSTGLLSRQEQMVLFSIQAMAGSAMKSFDFTTKDVAKEMLGYNYDKAYDICRKRFSGLFNKFKIVLTGERRDGCRVWRLL